MPLVVRRFGPRELLLLLGFGALAWVVAASMGLCVGSSGVVGWPARAILEERLESVLMASMIGAALSGAGVVCQAVLRNPLADPYLLGVSSGAALFAFVWRSTAIATMLGSVGYALSQQGFALAGGLLAAGAVFAIAGRRGRIEPVTLLLTGVIVNAVAASAYLLLNSLWKDRPGTGDPLNFLVGSIQTTMLGSPEVWTVAIVTLVGSVLLMVLAGQLNAASLSESEAMGLGVDVNRLRWMALALATLLTAGAVALSGPIGFVGLICPHLARRIVGPDVRRQLPAAIFAGAIVLCLADAGARLLAGTRGVGTVLPVGVLTGLAGGPFFLWIFASQSRRAIHAA